MKKFLAVLLTAAMLMGMAVPAFATGEGDPVISPADNATYFNEDVVISVYSEDEVPDITFDGADVEVDIFSGPNYTVTVPFAGKALGFHDIVVKIGNQEYKRTVEFCSNLANDRFNYKFLPEKGHKFTIYKDNFGEWDGRAIYNGTLTQIAGTDGVADGTAFTMTQTGGDAYTNIGYNQSELPVSGYLHSVAFDVRRGNTVGRFDLEAKNGSGSTVWVARPEDLITKDGEIDNSKVVLPANEWHNIEIVWELANKGLYWVYYDKELIYEGTSNYDLSVISLLKFQVKEGTLDFDNVSYGKYIVNPRIDSIGYVVNGKELPAGDGTISTGAEKIILNLTDAFSAVSGVKVNGAAADAQVDGKKLIITPAGELPANADVKIEVASATFNGITLSNGVNFKVKTSDIAFKINSPVNNASYFDEDVVISVTSPSEVPAVTFDGVAVALDNSKAPVYTATVAFADKALGSHDVVISTEDEVYTRTVEFYSNLATDRFTYKFLPEKGQKFIIYKDNFGEWDGRTINNGTLTQIAGTDGVADGTAFAMTKGSGDASVNIGYNESELPVSGYLHSVAFDVRRGNTVGRFDLEAKNGSNNTVWVARPEDLITKDGTIDYSGVLLPANEWHNIEIVWELADKGNYWIYLDKEMIYEGTSNYDLSAISLLKFQIKEGTLDFDNVSYGKYVVNPSVESIAYVEKGKELTAVGNTISARAEKIIFNFSGAYSAVNSVKVNGVDATAELEGNKLIVTPAVALPDNGVVNVELTSASISGMALSKSVIYKVVTSDIEFKINSPANNAKYNNEDVVISVVSPTGAPVVRFDGEAVSLNDSNAPTYTATVPFADASIGLHDVVIEAAGEKYTRTIEIVASNFATDRFRYTFSNSTQLGINRDGVGYWDGRTVENGTVAQIAGTDGETDGTAFSMTKVSGDAYANIGYNQSELPVSGYLHSVAFDVRRGDAVGRFDLEAKNGSGNTVWIARPEDIITADGLIDNSNVLLPANEWHNIEIVWELANKGLYWVYYDKELIYEGTSNYDLSTISLLKFQIKEGTLDFDNVSYGKYISPRVLSASFVEEGVEVQAANKVISPFASSITLNLTDAYAGGSISAANVKINGITAASASVDGNKLTVVPATTLEESAAVNVEVAGGAVISGVTVSKAINYRIYTGSLSDELVSFVIKEGEDSTVYAALEYNGGFGSGEQELMVVIGAFYGPNRLANGKVSYVPVSKGSNKITSEAISVPEGATVKAFLWTTDMSPIATAE